MVEKATAAPVPARSALPMPEPALRLAWYMKDLYGVMRDRFGQFQVARHYREVE